MKKQTFLALLLPVISLFLFSCAGTRPIEKMVPEESAFYFQIADPDQLLEDADLFLRSINMQNADMKLKDQLVSLMEGTIPALSEGILDFSRPVGLAGLPVSGETRPGFMLLLPLAKEARADKLRRVLEKKDNTFTLEHKGYLVVFSHKELMDTFPPDKPAELGHLRNYSSGALNAYINFEQFFSILDLDLDSLKAAMEEAETDNSEMAVRILDGYFTLFRQMDTTWAWLSAGEAGIEAGSDLFFRDDMARFLKSIRPVKGSTDFSVTLAGENSLFSGLYNIDPRDREALTDKLYSFILTFDGTPEAPVTEYLELSREMNRTIGPRGVFSMDLNIQPEAYARPMMMFNFQFTGIMELADPEAFETSLEELYSHPGMNLLFASIYGDEGLEWGVRLDEKSYGNISYREMSYIIPENPSMELEAAMLEQMKIYYVIKDDFCYFHMNMGGPVEAFLEKAASGAFMVRNGERPDWITRAPDSAHLIWNMRMKSFMEMVPSALGNSAFRVPDEPAGISGYTTVGEGVSSSMFIPSAEILWLMQSFAMLQAALGQQ
jgi:hypothetical protein